MSEPFPSNADIARSPTAVRAYLMQPRKEGDTVVCDFCDWQARAEKAERQRDWAREDAKAAEAKLERVRELPEKWRDRKSGVGTWYGGSAAVSLADELTAILEESRDD